VGLVQGVSPKRIPPAGLSGDNWRNAGTDLKQPVRDGGCPTLPNESPA
jgi:hypothetical protein